MLSFAEFQDLELLRSLLRAFSDDDEVATFFDNLPEKGLTIRIGDENSASEISACSMVVGSYSVGKKCRPSGAHRAKAHELYQVRGHGRSGAQRI